MVKELFNDLINEMEKNLSRPLSQKERKFVQWMINHHIRNQEMSKPGER